MLSNAQCVQGHVTFPHPPIDGEYTRLLGCAVHVFCVRIRLPPLLTFQHHATLGVVKDSTAAARLQSISTFPSSSSIPSTIPSTIHFATFSQFGFAHAIYHMMKLHPRYGRCHAVLCCGVESLTMIAANASHIPSIWNIGREPVLASGLMPMHYILVSVCIYMRFPHRSRSLTCTIILVV